MVWAPSHANSYHTLKAQKSQDALLWSLEWDMAQYSQESAATSSPNQDMKSGWCSSGDGAVADSLV